MEGYIEFNFHFDRNNYAKIGFIPAKMHCPDGWTMFADSCYLAGEAELDWTSARAWCQHNESSSDLVSIHSPLENDQVWGFMHDHGVNTWIGYTDR